MHSSESSTVDIDADARSDYSSSSSSSMPESVSDASLDKWMPGGIYVPIHRRRRSGSNTTSTSASTASTLVSSSPIPSKGAFAPLPRPRPGVYTRTELLALAPSSLIHASLHPLITPALLAKHPRILRARGDGVVHALDMARHDSNSSRSLHSHPPQFNFAHQQSEAAAKMGARVDTHVQMQTQSALMPTSRPSLASRTTHVNAQQSCATHNLPRPTRRRDRGRRRGNANPSATYQRNFAQQAGTIPSAHSGNANNTNANLDPSPPSNPTAESNTAKAFVPAPVSNSNRHRRQRLDAAILSSWRTPQAVAA
ncbi:hypothetical protein ACEPAF_1501 [Sanghuangporus sanghuang]